MRRRLTLTIVGSGWHAQVVAELAGLLNRYGRVEFLDRDWPAKKTWGDWRVAGGFDRLDENLASDSHEYVVALGDNAVRVALCREIMKNGGTLATLIHPHAFVSERATVGPGTVICAGATIQPYARIGVGCIVNTAASVDHHCELRDGVHLSPGVHLSGNDSIGERTWLGTGVSVRDKITIGADITVGVGAVVVSDLHERGVYFGVPSRKRPGKGSPSRKRTSD